MLSNAMSVMNLCVTDVAGFICLKGVTTCLYPLSVIKTRQMALEGPGGLRVIWTCMQQKTVICQNTIPLNSVVVWNHTSLQHQKLLLVHFVGKEQLWSLSRPYMLTIIERLTSLLH